jgi:hypothetical protein
MEKWVDINAYKLYFDEEDVRNLILNGISERSPNEQIRIRRYTFFPGSSACVLEEQREKQSRAPKASGGCGCLSGITAGFCRGGGGDRQPGAKILG